MKKRGIGRRGKGELKMKIEGTTKQWIGAANNQQKGCKQSRNGATNSQGMGLQTVRKTDKKTKGKKVNNEARKEG